VSDVIITADAVFSEISSHYLPALYLDSGLSLFKVGEEAIVNLSKFSIRREQRKIVTTSPVINMPARDNFRNYSLRESKIY